MWWTAACFAGHTRVNYMDMDIIDCVVCYNDALNFAKVCWAVNPQVRVLPGYRNYFMRLGYNQD